MNDSKPTDEVRRRVMGELGLSLTPGGDPDCSEEEWSILNRAVSLTLFRMRTQIEAGLHVKRLLPCDAIRHAGIASQAQLLSEIAEGRFDGQLCSLPLREL